MKKFYNIKTYTKTYNYRLRLTILISIYAEGYIVFVFSFVCSFVHSYFRQVCRICIKVLRQSFSSGVYLSNYLPESIHIWTIVTLEG